MNPLNRPGRAGSNGNAANPSYGLASSHSNGDYACGDSSTRRRSVVPSFFQFSGAVYKG